MTGIFYEIKYSAAKENYMKQQKNKIKDRHASKTDDRLDDFGTKFPLSKVFWDPIPAVSAGISSYYMTDIQYHGGVMIYIKMNTNPYVFQSLMSQNKWWFVAKSGKTWV